MPHVDEALGPGSEWKPAARRWLKAAAESGRSEAAGWLEVILPVGTRKKLTLTPARFRAQNVMAITQFFQFVVYDTINIRYEDWRTAYELMVLAFRKIEDCSDGAWNLVTVTGEIVMAGMMAEARMAAKHFHPVFFRTRGGGPQPSGVGTDDDSNPRIVDALTWNGESSNGLHCRFCPAFNAEHATKKGKSSEHSS